LKRDFDFVALLLKKFFEQEHIQNRFELIERKPITGWEIWLQVEFSIFLEAQADVSYWEREYQYSIDKRKARHRQFMAIDFIFRKKHSALDQYIALEIKQNSNVKSCIRGMMEDTCKVSKVKGSHDDLRSMWTLGVHPYSDKAVMLDIIHDYAENFEVELLNNCIITNQIKNTNLAYTVF